MQGLTVVTQASCCTHAPCIQTPLILSKLPTDSPRTPVACLLVKIIQTLCLRILKFLEQYTASNILLVAGKCLLCDKCKLVIGA